MNDLLGYAGLKVEYEPVNNNSKFEIRNSKFELRDYKTVGIME